MGYFIEEAKDHLNTIEQGLLNLQSTIADPELVNEVFRAAHSVKGGAAMLGLGSVQQTAHRLEDSFKILKECKVQVDQQLESLFLRVFDTLQALLEQLSSPFGLTEAVAENMLREVEPVFEELNRHLGELVNKGSSVGATASAFAGTKVVAMNNVGSLRDRGNSATLAATEESALQLIFRSDVTAQLREMLQLFKRPESSESRQQLALLCRRLQTAGEQFELRNWAELIGAVQKAIANPDNTYRTLAPTVIKDIKGAQELVLEGRSDEITVSSSLAALIPAVEVTDSDLEDLLAFAEDKNSQITDSDLDLPLLDFDSGDEALPLWDEIEPKDGADLETSEPAAWLEEVNTSWDSGGWGDGSGTEGGLSFEDSPEMATSSDRSELTGRRSDHTGPELGLAELNSLTDLFYQEMPDLDGTWEQEETTDFRVTNSALNQSATDGEDSSGDFTDLLFEGEGSPSQQTVAAAGTGDLASWFGADFMLSEDSSGTAAQEFWAQTEQPDAEAGDNASLSLLEESGLDADFFAEEGDGTSAEQMRSPSSSQDLASLFGEFSEADFPADLTASDATADNGTPTADQAVPEFDFQDFSEPSDSDSGAGGLSELNDLLEIGGLSEGGGEGEDSSVDNNWEDALNLDDLDSSLPEQESGGDLEALFGSLTSMTETHADIAVAAKRDAAAESEAGFEELFGLDGETVAAVAAAEAANWLDLESASEGEALPSLDFEWEDGSEEAVSAGSEQPDSATAPEVASDTSNLEGFEELLDGEVSAAALDSALLVTESDGFDRLLDAGDAATLSESLPSDVTSEDAGGSVWELETSEGDFADLEAMLDEVDTAEPLEAMAEADGDDLAASSTDVFSELDGLLSLDEELPSGSNSPKPAPAKEQLAAESSADEFSDLDSLLEQTQGSAPRDREGVVAPGARTGPRPNRPPRLDPTMRVPVKQMDNLSNLMGELVVNRNSLEQDQERMRQFLDNLLHQVTLLSDVGQRMQDLYERSLLEISLLASRQGHRTSWRTEEPVNDGNNGGRFGLSDIELDRFTPFHTLSQEIIELIVRVRESAADIEFLVDEADQVTRQLRQITTQLQEGLTRARMMPFSHTTDRLPRAVRDISIKCGKQAQLVVEGKDILIDKMILEQLFDPMTHLVNNAITHGIEPPEVRQAAGKSAVGRITIRAFHQGNQTVISVSDDGAGIDPQKVKAKALKQGLLTPAMAQKMSRAEVYDLLFLPGFSTQEQATEFAGRGVGMDVVRTNLSEIRGVISIDSTVGKGTVFTIRLPLILSISKALCCISDRARIAFPMDGVEDMIDVPREQVQVGADGQQCIEWRGSMLPFRHLRELLKHSRYLGRASIYGSNLEDDMISVIVLRSAGNFLAVQVDQVSTEQEIVIKQLEGPVPKPLGIAGATVLGDGRIVAIADVLELIDLATGRLQRDAGGMLWDENKDQAIELRDEPIEPTVLIVDDSITVRELLSMTFLKSGYRVEQARDGKEAWEKLKSGLPCEIVFCDIEMPKMDGLELLSRMQKDPTLCDLPIAMLTSRGADRHRQMAYSLGARGYFTKPYLEEQLLDAASRMIKGEVVGAPSATTA